MGSSAYSGQQLLLQHNDLGLQFREGFAKLREAEELLDVTLACEDDTLDVHKVVMSASSPFFRKVLLKAKQKHPFIYLKGVKFDHLKVIVDFVYKGEAFVAGDELDRFLEAAQELQITGLATDEDEEKKTPQKKTSNENTSVKNTMKNKDKKSKSASKELVLDNFEFETQSKAVEIKKEMGDAADAGDKPINDKQDVKLNIDEETLKELKNEVDKNTETTDDADGGKTYKCKLCGKEYKKKNKAGDHIETHLDKFNFSCEYCAKPLKNRKGLRSHIIYNHTKKRTEDQPMEESPEEEDEKKTESVV